MELVRYKDRILIRAGELNPVYTFKSGFDALPFGLEVLFGIFVAAPAMGESCVNAVFVIRFAKFDAQW
jgi:hypothetical protein